MTCMELDFHLLYLTLIFWFTNYALLEKNIVMKLIQWTLQWQMYIFILTDTLRSWFKYELCHKPHPPIRLWKEILSEYMLLHRCGTHQKVVNWQTSYCVKEKKIVCLSTPTVTILLTVPTSREKVWYFQLWVILRCSLRVKIYNLNVCLMLAGDLCCISSSFHKLSWQFIR